ncbi:MAG: hypothetical protein JO227_14130 [Acetobacteraceae bacterium]|nr:hypothetical protein [Acetobacteraceae bacterium]
MRHLPVFLDLIGRRAVVLGHGVAAERKAALLERAGAQVRIAAAFEESLLEKCALIIGVNAPDHDLRAASNAAICRGIPVNVVDRPELCSFIMPAIIDRDPVMIAVSTGGAAPVLARLLRQRIERILAPSLGRLAALFAEYTPELRRRLPEPRRRRRVLERLLSGPIADLVAARNEAAARKLLEQQLGHPDADDDLVSGAVFLIESAFGSADLLTLRAHRLLGEADVIVHEPEVSSEILDLGRRDADVISTGRLELPVTELLIRLARDGNKVVRLRNSGRLHQETEALAEAGVFFEVLPRAASANSH